MAKRIDVTSRARTPDPDDARFAMLDIECEQLRVALEDAVQQVDAQASRIVELETECARLASMNDRLLGATVELAKYRDANSGLRDRLSKAGDDLRTEREAHRKAQAGHSAANEALAVSNEELEAANEELRATNNALARKNDQLRSANTELAIQRMTARENETRLRTVLDTTDALVVTTDARGRIATFNRACERLTGFRQEEVVGKSAIGTLVPPDERKAVRAVRRALLDGAGKTRNENHWLTRDGERRRIAWTLSVIRDEHGKVRQTVASGIDVTDLRDTERRIRERNAEVFQLMRITTINEMGTLMAHELFQPLSALASYAESCLDMAKAKDPPDTALSETIEKVVVQAQRASKVIVHLRDMARSGAPIEAPFDLERALRDAVAFIEPEARAESVKLITRLADDLPAVRGDRLQIEQVVINLIRNGIEAISAHASKRRRVTVEAKADKGNGVEVAVKDTGPGLPGSFRRQLFQPFVTTKRRGLGMGLSICRSIVEQHRGSLTATSRPGGGAVFRFSLPVANEGRDRAG